MNVKQPRYVRQPIAFGVLSSVYSGAPGPITVLNGEFDARLSSISLDRTGHQQGEQSFMELGASAHPAVDATACCLAAARSCPPFSLIARRTCAMKSSRVAATCDMRSIETHFRNRNTNGRFARGQAFRQL